jgi:hypothetical protein
VLAFVSSNLYPEALVIDGDNIAVVKSMFQKFIMAVRTFFRVRKIIILAELRIFFYRYFKVMNDLHLRSHPKYSDNILSDYFRKWKCLF